MNESVVDAVVVMFDDFESTKSVLSLSRPKDAQDQNSEEIFFNTAFNNCRLSDGVFPSYVVKAILDEMSAYIDFEVKCPFIKRTYKATGWKAPDIFYPFPKDSKIKCNYKIFGKIANKKILVKLFEVNFIFKV